MSDLSAMLHDEDLCRYCPIYATRTKTNQALKPIAEYVTVFADQPSQSGHRRYKYSEGCKKLQLTDKGKHLDPSTLLDGGAVTRTVAHFNGKRGSRVQTSRND